MSSILLSGGIADNSQTEGRWLFYAAQAQLLIVTDCYMNTFTFSAALAGVLLLLAGENVFAQQNAVRTAPVGMTVRSFVDSSRHNWEGTAPRPLQTAIWFPAAEPAREDTVYIGSPQAPLFIAGEAAQNSALSSTQQRYPLVLLSHGTGGAALQMMWLGSYLAAHGYIAVAVDHHGNSAAEDRYTPQGFVLVWERTKDLSVVIDHLLADPQFGKRIDRQRIGAAGFSLGGYTVVSLAGGITDLRAYEMFCSSPERDATCEPQAEFPDMFEAFERMKDDPQVQRSLDRHNASYKDERVRAVSAIAPALGGAFTEAGLTPIEIPVRIVAGQADTVAPVATNAKRFAAAIKDAQLTVLPEVGHYTFLAECTEIGESELPLFCMEQGMDRSTVHRRTSHLVLQFFNRTL